MTPTPATVAGVSVGSARAMDPVAQIGFGQVRHTRLRPVRNAFAYPGFFLLLPMRSLQDPACAGAQAALACNRPGLLSFHDADHGDGRSPAQGGALAWLDALLRGHGILDATGEVWLHCYPRVFGYTFKPVSFWFCHRAADDRQGGLRAIVVEVNNTFGERHCYLLENPRLGVELRADKVFHVSPFLPLRGGYRFRFMRSDAAQGVRTVCRVDYDEAEGPTLQTSVSGTLCPATAAAIRMALWRYPAATAMVVLRIHWQALRLWLRGAPFFRKPTRPPVFVTRAGPKPASPTAHHPAQ